MPASTEHPLWEDMQGLVLSAYPHLDCAQYLVFTIRDPEASRDWLRRLLCDKRFTRASKKHDGRSVNVALTARGLLRMCGGPADLSADDLSARLPGFSHPFIEGIAGRGHRSRILGHVGESAPSNWCWGGNARNADPVDLLLMVFANDEEALDNELARVRPPSEAMQDVHTLQKTLSLRVANKHEHFGFMDGISQPILEGSPDAERFPGSTHLTALGEFVFGYGDQAGEPAVPPPLGICDRFGENGSYLVLSQYEQHVVEFWQFMNEVAQARGRSSADTAEQLASKIVGRCPDGAPLVPYANRDDNEFDFTEDPFGYGCPLGSHIRRSNPRDASEERANRHRILRRGRSYGPRVDKGQRTAETRGLFFMCLNADLERQFEFIQQNWTNNPAFAGLSGEIDPLIGNSAACAGHKGVFTIPSLPVPTRIGGVRPFVTVKGGQYFFLPGITGLTALAEDRCGL
jgi:Dyp-type peroxidase family